MSELRVENLNSQTGTDKGPSVEQIIRRRLELHSTSRYEKSRKTFAGIGKQDLSAVNGSAEESEEKTPAEVEEAETFQMFDGNVLEMPRAPKDERAWFEQMMGGLDSET